ncbi:MAG: hypothetical protein QW279_09705, partial [Candidatus Jordarchaeaceae archaeon]
MKQANNTKNTRKKKTIIEDAQQLQLITAHKENGETKYRLNHQILEATQKQEKPKTKKRKQTK